jgi:serine/threonine-protein kinase HSL1 (negative regulator of Swe1 kinase)
LALEYAENGELFKHIAVKGKLEEKKAMRIFRQILSAVGYCHSLNIYHRDLNPDNILLTKTGDVKITGFGMATFQRTAIHKMRTFSHYAAPELNEGVSYDGDKVDIWSMGVILYSMLSGRLPFDFEVSSKSFLSTLFQEIKAGSYTISPGFPGSPHPT